MLLRLSRFVHLLPVGPGRTLVVDAISHVRLTVNDELAAAIRHFSTPDEVADSAVADPVLAGLLQRGILTEKTPEQEMAHIAGLLGPYHGRDPEELLDRFQLAAREGADPYFTVAAALTPGDITAGGRKVTLLLFGDCDVQMESDFLRREAASRGFDLKVAASFTDDLRLASEHDHDAILIGALRYRYLIAQSGEVPPHAAFIAEARVLLDGLRARTDKPILIDNLPEPTVQPLGLAERGARGHRNRFRAANIAMAELVEDYADVHVVDIAAALAGAGAEKLLDDGLVPFAHFGSPGWMLQRPEKEKAAVHNLFPDIAPLAQELGGDPYLREAVTARLHLNVLSAALALDRKKCVIVDLDGLLWPGVLAETGQPFAWKPETSSPYSYIGLYLGLHEALLLLKQRGILLACVSKNDEAIVRELWKYGPQYEQMGLPLLTPDDFVTWRVNWNDKVENILSIAGALGLAPETFVFLDDNPVERDRVRQRLPEVEVWGENPFTLRRQLLNDPRLQLPRITAESAVRTNLAKTQLERQAARAGSLSEKDFVATLGVETNVMRPSPDVLDRVEELFQRTTQFNTTGVKYSVAELEGLMRDPDAQIFIAQVKDRFGDHGLVGAAVIRQGEILGLVLSCRVLGMGVEHDFLRQIIKALEPTRLWGRIIETARNIPVRNFFSDNDFVVVDNVWRHAVTATGSS